MLWILIVYVIFGIGLLRFNFERFQGAAVLKGMALIAWLLILLEVIIQVVFF